MNGTLIMLALLLKCFSAFCGALLLYLAFFTYEDEQKTLQSSLEEFWLQMNKLKDDGPAWRTAFLRGVAGFAIVVLDRIFGNRFVSLQAICVAFFLIIAFMNIFIGAYIFPHGMPSAAEASAPMNLIGLFLGLLPGFFQNRWTTRIVCGLALVGMALFLGVGICGALHSFTGFSAQQGIELAEALCVLFSVLAFVAITRKALTWSADSGSSMRISLVALANVGLAVGLVAPLIMDAFEVVPSWAQDGKGLFIWSLLSDFAFGNCLTIVIALLIVVLLIMVAAHRLVWSVVDRPLYALQRFGVVTRPVLLSTIAVIFLSTLLPKQIIELLNKVIH